MLPVEINDLLKRDVIGQKEALRFVSVALFKHLSGERFGNLMLIGSSGTGKTTIMHSIERLYEEHEELQQYRTVIIVNANTFASDEGLVDTSRLFVRLEERARRILGDDAEPEEIGRYMQHATVCMDEIDKVSGTIGGKPYITGINIQQALLTLIEGESVDWKLHTGNKRGVVHIDTG
jgi:ATP-dependent Clp protease ATP-binding subunit ClpX